MISSTAITDFVVTAGLRYDGPRLMPAEVISSLATYRDAVRACWEHRRRERMTSRQLAEEAGLYPSHVSDYLSDRPERRELPARHIKTFEQICDNRIVTQWLAYQANLTILEQYIDQRAAA